VTNKYTKYGDIPFTAQQWQILKKAIDQDIDVDDIADERFQPEQLEVLVKGKTYHVDITVINDPAIPAEQMNGILEHIMAEMGIYEDHYENVRRKWLKNTTWLLILLVFSLGGIFLYFANKDVIASYTNELVLEVEDEVTIEAGSKFHAADYIVSFTDTAKLTLPKVNTALPGIQYVEYGIANEAKQKTATLKLNVVDTTAPKIRLHQDYVSLKDVSAFSCRDYLKSAMDSVDGDVSDRVTCSPFDVNAKHQEIQYSVSDAAGNKATAILPVDIAEEKVSVPSKPKPAQEVVQAKEQEATNDPKPQQGKVSVRAQSKDYLFQDGDTFEGIFAQCQNDGQGALARRQANGFSCNPIPDPKGNGLYIGYSLVFK